jgi:hypothetical protein
VQGIEQVKQGMIFDNTQRYRKDVSELAVITERFEQLLPVVAGTEHWCLTNELELDTEVVRRQPVVIKHYNSLLFSCIQLGIILYHRGVSVG